MESREKLKYLTEEEREKYLDLSSKKEELESLLLFKDSNGGYSVSDDYGSVGISTNLMNTRIEDYKDKLKELEDFIVARSNIEPPYYWDSKSESITKSEETRPTGEEELKNWREKLLKTIGYWYMDNGEHDTTCPVCGISADKLIEFVAEQLSLAREEGWNDHQEYTNIKSNKYGVCMEVLARIDELEKKYSLTNQSKDEKAI